MSKFSQPSTFFGRKTKGQKGISLYLSIIIMAILLAIVLGISGILLGQLKIMKGMENSVIAFYAADTGIERILVDRENPKASSAISCTKDYCCDVGNGATYYIEVKAKGEGNCNAEHFCIGSVGTYNKTKRAIQITY